VTTLWHPQLPWRAAAVARCACAARRLQAAAASAVAALQLPPVVLRMAAMAVMRVVVLLLLLVLVLVLGRRARALRRAPATGWWRATMQCQWGRASAMQRRHRRPRVEATTVVGMVVCQVLQVLMLWIVMPSVWMRAARVTVVQLRDAAVQEVGHRRRQDSMRRNVCAERPAMHAASPCKRSRLLQRGPAMG